MEYMVDNLFQLLIVIIKYRRKKCHKIVEITFNCLLPLTPFQLAKGELIKYELLSYLFEFCSTFEESEWKIVTTYYKFNYKCVCIISLGL